MADMAGDPSFRAAHMPPIQMDFTPKYGHMGEVAGAQDFIVPANTGSKGAVVMIHEWWGLNNQIKSTAEKLHEATGFGVIAVDLYGGKVTSKPDEAAKLMQAVDDSAAKAQLRATVDSILKDHVLGDSVTKIGTIGYCFGGGYSLQTALVCGPQVSACVMYYGFPETDPTKLTSLSAPVLGNFANKDTFITPALVDKFAVAMRAAGKKLIVHRYDAVHGFANPSNPKYDKAATADAWKHSVAFLKKYLD